MIQFTSFTRALVAGVLAAAALPALADVVVVVSAKSTATALTADQASDIFLGRATTLPGAGAVAPVDQAEGSAARDAFYQKATGKNAAQVKAFWSKQIFSGKGTPPKDAGSDAGVKTMVAANPNLIGYIDKGAVDGSVKALLTIK
jgi:ABC-type phosphate transport system substrate-binding protein